MKRSGLIIDLVSSNLFSALNFHSITLEVDLYLRRAKAAGFFLYFSMYVVANKVCMFDQLHLRSV